jgi:hypothetical protein
MVMRFRIRVKNRNPGPPSGREIALRIGTMK